MIPKPTVLIVDDEKEIRESIHNFLTKRVNATCELAADGATALTILEQQMPEVIILDINMPGVSGREVLETARKKSSDVPIIVITRWDSPELARMVEAADAIYMPKPFSLKVILQLVNEHLEKKS